MTVQQAFVLKHVAKIIDCEHRTAPRAPEGEAYGYSVGTGSIRDGRIDLSKAKPVTQTTYEDWTRRTKPHRGDIILAREAPIGQAGLVPASDPVCLGQRTVLIRPDETQLRARFLHHWLLSPYIQRWFRSKATGSTVPHVNVADVRNIPLGSLVTLSEQQRIVDILEDHLSRLDAANSMLLQSISRLELLERAMIDDIFMRRADDEKWPVVRLEEIASSERRSITDGPFGSNLTSAHYTASGARVIRLQNIGDGIFKHGDAFISVEHYRNLTVHDVRAGDLVIASLGDQLPRAAIVPDLGGPAIVKADCIRIRPRHDLDPMWVAYACRTSRLKRWAEARAHGVGRLRLGMKGIREIPLPLPEPPALRAEVIRHLTAQFYELSRLRSEFSTATAHREALQRSLLAAAFSGRLTGRAGDIEIVEEMAGV